MTVCWFSSGVSSFMACYLMREKIDEIIYTHVTDQHEDSIRFLHDCEKILGREIKIIQSEDYMGVDDVIEKVRYINGPSGAACTRTLKRDVRKNWERQHPGFHRYVWGFDFYEKERAKNIELVLSDYEHSFPLIENHLTKAACHGIAYELGLKRPVMYDMGYPNNNCIGCVKGGAGYWNKIRIDFPEVFKRRAMQERLIGHSCIQDVFLDELRPGSGRLDMEIMEDCTITCQLMIR